MPISLWIATIYVIIWIILLFVLGIGFAERPASNSSDQAPEYVWKNMQGVAIAFLIMTVLLPLLLLWAVVDLFTHYNRKNFEYVLGQIKGGTVTCENGGIATVTRPDFDGCPTDGDVVTVHADLDRHHGMMPIV